jgi:hypothetical protein
MKELAYICEHTREHLWTLSLEGDVKVVNAEVKQGETKWCHLKQIKPAQDKVFTG